jgi:hypothetical protein
MLNIYCKMCNHVARDEQALVEHVSNEHGLGLYVIELQKKIAEVEKRTYPSQ